MFAFIKDSDTRSWAGGVIGSLIILLTLGCVKEPVQEIVIELEALFQQWLKEQENGFANL